MRFDGVNILGVAHVDAPHRVATLEFDRALSETYARLGVPERLIESLTGVRARRFWDPGSPPSEGAALAARRVLQETGIAPGQVGVMINTSVSRDWVEPSTACFVHASLALPETCINFDIANACLGFLDGMTMVANMIERGQVDYGLVVDGESSRFVVESTLQRLRSPACDHQMLKDQLATMTLGSGAAAMVLASARVAPQGHKFVGTTSLAATTHNQLCRGQVDVGVTDTRGLLTHGLALASRTWQRMQSDFGLRPDMVDLFALHQVSELHTQELARTLGVSLEKAHLIYQEIGNVGPASVPMVLSKAQEQERLTPGDHVVLAGIGSGLNCTAGLVLW